MLSFRHGCHAGNFADVLKHLVLVLTLEYLQSKPAPIRYIDTHAGAGSYDLVGDLSRRTGEATAGVRALDLHGLPAAASAFGQLIQLWNRADADKPLAPMSWPLPHIHVLRGTGTPVQWTQRLKRVFAIDIETCPYCGGTLRVSACIEAPALIARILEHVQQREEWNGPLTRAPPGQQEVTFNLN